MELQAKCLKLQLSPMIFILVVEVLTKFMLTDQVKGLIHGFTGSSGELGIPVLQFVDDTLVLVNRYINEVRNVKNLLSWFESFSGL